eukprot:CAMPEP_0176248306 /NCGR_PEP_ID=MMETSP0121_2-20121125/33400_1 /TAXON_ID=160619 /ORGANISM="Kryptoperidinium foliaceum, Strain CCMP 1326" /LENGTH=334 /DNA_ID=CAMNT_0017587983 /DNA_START=146 /DNA_END=1150 /DNA_ORIENTATION=+
MLSLAAFEMEQLPIWRAGRATRGAAALVASTTSAAPETTSGHFDCSAAAKSWWKEWSREKQRYCCDLTSGASVAPLPQGRSSTGSPSIARRPCALGAQATGARDVQGVGCSAAGAEAVPPAAAFECQAREGAWARAWSQEKKDWCCRTAKVGCPASAASASEAGTSEFYCSSKNGFSAWSAEHRHWCCQHAGMGCDDLAEPLPGPPAPSPLGLAAVVTSLPTEVSAPGHTRRTTTELRTPPRALPEQATQLALFKQRMSRKYQNSQEAFAAMDLDGSGSLEREEFVASAARLELLQGRAQADYAFDRFDVNHNQDIEPVEFYGTLNDLPGWLLD